MKKTLSTILLTTSLALASAFAQNPNTQPQNPSARGEMKESGSEVKAAGKAAGHYASRGQVASGGKEFGKHVGRAGKHFGRGVKKGAKQAAK
jgi:hypothetical protein